jgi:hypothetical protein
VINHCFADALSGLHYRRGYDVIEFAARDAHTALGLELAPEAVRERAYAKLLSSAAAQRHAQ